MICSLLVVFDKPIKMASNNSSTLDITQTITLIAVILTFLVGIFNICFNIHRSKLDGITKNRNEWINNVRNITAKILLYDPRLADSQERLNELNAELLQNAYLLSLLLNVAGHFDATIIQFLKNFVGARELRMDKEQANVGLIKNRRLLHLSIQLYLKCEWERIKWEHKISICKHDTEYFLKKTFKDFNLEEDSIILDIEKEYNNFLKKEKLTTQPFIEIIHANANATLSTSATATASSDQAE